DTRFSRDWSSDVCSSDLKYTIPMQFAVFGRVVENRRTRHAIGAAVAGVALALAAAVWLVPRPQSAPAQWLALAAAGSAGGWFSADRKSDALGKGAGRAQQ